MLVLARSFTVLTVSTALMYNNVSALFGPEKLSDLSLSGTGSIALNL